MLNRHLMTYLPVYGAQALVGFGSVVVFTRIMSADDYGRYMLLLAAAALFGTLVFTWLDAAIARYHARASARGRTPANLYSAFEIFAILALVSLLAIALTIGLAPLAADLKTTLGFALAYSVVRSGVTLCLEVRRAGGEAGRYSVLETSSTVMGFTFGIALLQLTDLGPAGPFVGMILASVIVLVLDAPVLLAKAKKDRAHTIRRLTFFAYGAPVAISLIFEGLLTTGDRFIIAALMNEAATGAYAAGYAIADRSISIIFLWLGSTTGPLLVMALEQEGRAAARETARKTAALMGLIGFPAATGLALVAGPAARVLIGQELQQDAASIIPLIAVSGLMNGVMTYYFHEAFTLGRKPKAMATVMAGTAILNLILNLILIPGFGIVGAALSTVIAYAIALIICVVYGRTIFLLPVPFADWIKAGLSCAVMAVVILLVPSSELAIIELLVSIGLGALSYGVCAFALNIAACREQIITLASRRQEQAS